MAQVLSVAAIVAAFAIGLAAQQEKMKERTKIETDDAKVVTLTGCLRASRDGFDLTEVARVATDERRKESRTPKMVMLREVPATLNLQEYVGHRVAITGAAEEDVFEDIEVEVRTERTGEQKGRPDAKAKTKAEVEADPSGHNILVPVSVREIAETCR
jgi:hypothetical protein